MKACLEAAQKLGREEELKAAVKRGLPIVIKQIESGRWGLSWGGWRRGEYWEKMIEDAIRVFDLEQFRPSYTTAISEWSKKCVTRWINDLNENRPSGDFAENFEQIMKRVPASLAEELEQARSAYRKRKKERKEKAARIYDQIPKLCEKHGLEPERYCVDDQCNIIIWFEKHWHSGLITDTVMEEHNAKHQKTLTFYIGHYSYTPEDMDKPLEEYYYFGAKIKDEKLLETAFIEAIEIKEEINKAYEKLLEQSREEQKKKKREILEAAGLA